MLHPAKRVDVEALSDVEKRQLASFPHAVAAARMGRETAFKDIEERGFAYAHHWAESVMGARDFTDMMYNKTWNFMSAYKEAVLGYWMAM